MTDQEISQLSEELQVLGLKVQNAVLRRDLALLQSEQSKLPMTGAQAQEMLELLRPMAADMAAIHALLERNAPDGSRVIPVVSQ